MAAKPTSTSKTGSKTSEDSTKKSHPPYASMVKAAVAELNERSGSSRQAILKLLTAKYSLGPNASKVVNNTLKKLCEEKELVHAKAGTVGANGSFKLASKAAPIKKEATKTDGKSEVPKTKTMNKATVKEAKTKPVQSSASSAESSAAETDSEAKPAKVTKVTVAATKSSKNATTGAKKKVKKPRVTMTPASKKFRSRRSKSPTKPKVKAARKI